jgi:hypothetical protein
MVPLVGAAEIEVAGRLMGRVVPDAIKYPECGVHYNLIVAVDTPARQIDNDAEELRRHVKQTCGRHPPIIQKQ